MAARTLYVSRTLLNGNDLIAWAKGQGFAKTLIDGDLHVTVAYSKEPFEQDGLAPSRTRLIAAQGQRALKAFGDEGKAIVLSFDSPDLHARWKELRDAGASWDWPGYQPHVTFTYEPGAVDLDAIEPFTGALHFGPEIFAEIDDDWSSKVAEKLAQERRMSELSLFLPLTKVDAAQRLVYGVATAESLDRSGEVCDYASTKPFYEKWSGGISKATDGKSLGNLRAMHGKVAAGKVTSIAFNDDARQIEVCAKVVDDAEWKKVEEGVYTGFSQGGAYAKRWKDDAGVMRYTADPSEISLVDLPCLPSATFQVMKADGAAETRPFAEAVRIEPPAPPSNAAVAEKAADLAKAAGQDGKVGDFVEAAREALVKAAEAEALAKARPVPPTPAAAPEPAPVVDGEVEQVWKAKDGTTFAKKADALAHNATAEADAAAKATAAPVLAALADLGKTLGVEKAEAEPAPPTPRKKPRQAAAKAISADDLAKDLYGVSRLACLLSEIKGMVSSAVFDVVYSEGDAALPGQIKAWAAQGVTLLQTMVSAEMADLMGDEPGEAEMALAAGPLSDDAFGALVKAIDPATPGGQALAKVGARNSKADQDRVQRMHDDACGLGATCGDAAKAAGGDLAKVTESLDASTAQLAKMTGERDALQKTLTEEVLPQIAALAKAAEAEREANHAEREASQKDRAELASIKKMLGEQPVPRHLVGRVVTKGAEGGGAESASADDMAAAFAKMSPDDRATLMIKLAQQNPQSLPLAR